MPVATLQEPKLLYVKPSLAEYRLQGLGLESSAGVPRNRCCPSIGMSHSCVPTTCPDDYKAGAEQLRQHVIGSDARESRHFARLARDRHLDAPEERSAVAFGNRKPLLKKVFDAESDSVSCVCERLINCFALGDDTRQRRDDGGVTTIRVWFEDDGESAVRVHGWVFFERHTSSFPRIARTPRCNRVVNGAARFRERKNRALRVAPHACTTSKEPDSPGALAIRKEFLLMRVRPSFGCGYTGTVDAS